MEKDEVNVMDKGVDKERSLYPKHVAESFYQGFISKLWSFFSSVRLTIVLLITLALVSIIGTVIQQGERPEVYIKEYGERLYSLFVFLGFTDMYHAFWFTLLLGLLTLNIVVCTIDRFPAKWRSVLKQSNDDVSLKFLKNLPNRAVISGIEGKAEEVKEIILDILKSYHYRYKVSISQEDVTIAAYRGKWGRFGSDIVHVSIILILVGAIIGSIWGFRDFLPINVGDTVSVPNADFKLKVNKFWMDYYETGEIKQYFSDLTILEGDKEVLNKVIYVNEPLLYKGIRFYQSSYGYAWEKIEKAKLAVFNKDSGKPVGESFEIKWNDGVVDVPSTGYNIKLIGFVPDFAFDEKTKTVYTKSVEHDNPAIQLEVYKEGKPISRPWLFLNFPGILPVFGDSVDYDLVLMGYQPIQFTGLQLTKDPGVNVVWLGSILMGVGFILAFFIFHKRLWIKVKSCSNTVDVYVGGMINKNKIAFEREFDKIVNSIKDKLKDTSK